MHKPTPLITQDALAIWKAGVAAVDASTACRSSIHYEAPYLIIDDQEYTLKASSKIIIVGAGKAARGMLTGTCDALREAGLEDRIHGWVNVPGEGPTESYSCDRLFIHPSRPLGSNLPTPKAMYGTQKISSLLNHSHPDDLVICLLSGGGSSLLVDPISELTLENKTKLTRALSMAGANIHQLNVVRRALSKVKGGGLLRACRADQLATLVISDVLNDDLATIASGPTIASACVEPLAAIEIVKCLLGEQHQMTALVRGVLDLSASGRWRDVPLRLPSRQHVHVLANNATAVDAAGTKAVELGYRYMMYCHRESEGDARDVGVAMVRNLKTLQQSSNIDCEIVGGEPTVNMQDILDCGEIPGRGVVISTLSPLQHLNFWSRWINFASLSFVYFLGVPTEKTAIRMRQALGSTIQR